MVGYINTEAALTLYSKNMAHFKEAFPDLGLKDPSLSPELEAKAKKELAEGALSEPTRKELQTAIAVFFTEFKALLNKSITEVLKAGLKSTTSETAKAEMTAELEALRANKPKTIPAS